MGPVRSGSYEVPSREDVGETCLPVKGCCQKAWDRSDTKGQADTSVAVTLKKHFTRKGSESCKKLLKKFFPLSTRGFTEKLDEPQTH